MPKKVRIHKNQIYVGNQKVSVLSGEVHYWRLNPNYWREVLKRVREMGLEMISTYIPWDFHEYQRGKLDFTGKTDPCRNLKAFLELTRKEGFWVIIRPGPYIYSEWPNEGAPAYAYKYHRLHPKFLEYASVYMQKVTKVLLPYLATRKGGHIVLFQADNEIDAWPDVFGQQYGLNGKPGLFQEFIRDLYQNDLNHLNECWGTDYQSFRETGAFIATMLQSEPGYPLKGDKELQRNIDYFKFKYYYAKRYAKWMVDSYRKLGVDVPIYLNLYPFFYAHDWIEMQSVCDVVGVDMYPLAELSEDQYEQRKIIDKVRYLKTVSTLPFVAEFASGVWHQRHYETGVLTPNHYRLLVLSSILGGICGWNWYMLVNRDNWYMSPINEWGRVRGELFQVFKEMVTIFNKMHPPTLQKLNHIAVTFNPIQHAARTLTHNSPILVSLYDSDVDYELYDPRTPLCDKEILFYSGNQWIDTVSHKNLRKYIEQGGTLVAFRNYPRKDDKFNPCSIIGFEDPDRTLFEFKKPFTFQIDAGRPKLTAVSSIFSFDKVKGKKITADFGSYGRHTIGYIKNIGKGKIMHLGIEPSREIVLEIIRYFNIPVASYSPTRDIKTALFKRNQTHYLVIVNNGDEDKSANIRIPALDKYRGKMIFRNLDTDEREKFSFPNPHPFTVEIPRKNGKVFELKKA
ncbi:MAG: beta-galactosidase [Candidatus Omnitrophica bacterium]|nr:beta-galactosidase [Candidatus Omnitrophota bacterium]